MKKWAYVLVIMTFFFAELGNCFEPIGFLCKADSTNITFQKEFDGKAQFLKINDSVFFGNDISIKEVDNTTLFEVSNDNYKMTLKVPFSNYKKPFTAQLITQRFDSTVNDTTTSLDCQSF